MKVVFKPKKVVVFDAKTHKREVQATDEYDVYVTDPEEKGKINIMTGATVLPEKLLYRLHYVGKHWVLVRVHDSMPMEVFHTIGEAVKHFSGDPKVLCLFCVQQPILKNFVTHYPESTSTPKSEPRRWNSLHYADLEDLYCLWGSFYDIVGYAQYSHAQFLERHAVITLVEEHVMCLIDSYSKQKRFHMDTYVDFVRTAYEIHGFNRSGFDSRHWKEWMNPFDVRNWK